MAQKGSGKGDSEVVVEVTDDGGVGEIAAVETRLSRLYRQVSGPEAETHAIPISRAILFNLLICAHTEKSAARVVASAGKIVGAHPCRAIVVEKAGPRDGETSADVSVVCGITQRGERQLCGEVIRIHAHEEGDVVGSVLPLLIPDVPVVIWVVDDIPREDPDLHDLVSMANRLIVDSRRFSNVRDGLAAAMALGRTQSLQGAVHDLVWTSLLPWRELTAEHFDPPSLRPYLHQLAEVDVRAGTWSDDGSPRGPLLFVSWLIERLGLRVDGADKKNGDYRIDCRQDDSPVAINLTVESEEAAQAEMLSVTIRCRAGRQMAAFVTRGVSETELIATDECAGIYFPPRVIETCSQEESALVSQALDLPRRDKVYMAVLAVACDLLDHFSNGGQYRR